MKMNMEKQKSVIGARKVKVHSSSFYIFQLFFRKLLHKIESLFLETERDHFLNF